MTLPPAKDEGLEELPDRIVIVHEPTSETTFGARANEVPLDAPAQEITSEDRSTGAEVTEDGPPTQEWRPEDDEPVTEEWRFWPDEPVARPEPEPEPEREPEPVAQTRSSRADLDALVARMAAAEEPEAEPAPVPARDETDPGTLRPTAPEPVLAGTMSPSSARRTPSRLRSVLGLVIVVVCSGIALAAGIGAAVALVTLVLQNAFG
ncbi:MAG TPA: hypothetical protein VM143_11085 [Acidimicrobiales bacterium]|nr:hypothetical protein [Acidimicrobiales bacterium]